MTYRLPKDWKPKWAATLVYILRGDEVLLIDKLRGHGEGKVNVPGGKIESETPEEGAIREVKEEVGLVVEDLNLVAKLRFHDFETDYRVLGYVFTTSQFSGDPRTTDEANPFWCPRQKIPYERMWEDDRLWLPVVLAGQYSDADLLFENDVLVAHEIKISEFALP
ncbi:MAG: 8-oxo-dGTP diphosphatase [Gammaproteobacteria bacterium]|nr:8-oxo-dGTP diphosphatase [Gammaproteobacteria bacterium]